MTVDDSNYPQLLRRALTHGYISPAQAQRCLEQNQSQSQKQPWASWLLKHHYLSLRQIQQLLAISTIDTDSPSDTVQHVNLRLNGLRPGTRVGRFTIIKLLGAGGMGAVYLARQDFPTRDLALKLLTKVSEFSRSQSDRFLREGRLSGKLDHPNIVKTYLAGVEQGIPFIAMAYIEGQTLDQYLLDNPLTLNEKLNIVVVIAQALDYAHQKGVIHRDIKPANIMIAENGQPFLMDFGIAKSMNKADKKLTKTGVLVGTPNYMSPEQIQEQKEVDASTDIYSLGAVLYEMVTGSLLFQGENDLALLYRISFELPALPRQFDSTIPHAVEAIILKSIEKNKNKRYTSADKMAQDIQRYLNGQAVKASSGHGFRKARWQLISHRKLAVAILMAVLILISICYSLHSLKNPDPDQTRANSIWLQIEQLERELQLKPTARLFLQYLEILVQNHYYQAGLNKCQEAIVWAKDYPDYLRKFQAIKAELLFLSGDYPGSYRLYGQIKWPENWQKWQWARQQLRWGQVAFLLKKYTHVESILSAINPNVAGIDISKREYYFYYGASVLHIFLVGLSRGIYLQQIKNQSFAYDLRIRRNDAIALLNKAYEESSGTKDHLARQIEVYLGYGYVCHRYLDQARQYLFPWQKFLSQDLLCQEAAGVLHYCQGNYDQSIVCFSRCIELAPWDSHYYHLRAQCYLQYSAPPVEEIINDCMKTIKLNPSNLSIFGTLIAAMFKIKAFGKLFLIYSSIVDYLWQNKQQVAPDLWQPEHQELAAYYLRKNFDEQASSQISQQKIDFLVKALTEMNTRGALLLAQNSLLAIANDEKVRKSLDAAMRHFTSDKKIFARLKAVDGLLAREHRLRSERSFVQELVRSWQGQDSALYAPIGQREKLVTTLKKLLYQETDVFLRYWIAKILCDWRLPSALKVLREGCQDDDIVVKCYCRCALRQAGFSDIPIDISLQELKRLPAQSLSIFLHYLGQDLPGNLCREFLRHQHEKVRIAAAKSLLSSNDQGAIRVLVESFASDAEEIRYYAYYYARPLLEGTAGQLAYLDSYLTAIIKDISPQVRISALQVLGEIGNHITGEYRERTVKKLRQSLANERHEMVRFYTLQALFNLQHTDIVLTQIFAPQECYANKAMFFIQIILGITKDKTSAQLGGQLFKLVDSQKTLEKDDPNFASLLLFTFGHLGGVKGSWAKIFITSFVYTKISQALESSSREIRKAAAYSCILVNDDRGQWLKILQKRMEQESDDEVKANIVAAMTHLIVAYRSDRKRQIIIDLQKKAPKYQKAIAYGYYHFFERLYSMESYRRWLPLTTFWGRERRFLNFLRAIYVPICLDSSNNWRKTSLQQVAEIKQRSRIGYPAVYRLACKVETVLSRNQNNWKKIGRDRHNVALLQRFQVVAGILQCFQKFQPAKELDAENDLYFFTSAFFSYMLGNYSSSCQDLQRARLLNSQSFLYPMFQARLYLQSGRLGDAQEIVESLARKNIVMPELYALQGEIYLAFEKWDLAKEAFYRQQLIENTMPQPYINIAHCQMWCGDTEGADKQLQQAKRFLALERKRTQGIYQNLNAWRTPLTIYLDRMAAEYYFALGRLAIKRNHRKQAIEYLGKSANLFAKNIANIPYNLFSKSNLRRYSEFRALLKSGQLGKLPEKISGLTYQD